uniref:Uncharacterized protein n=1 Tax=Opuntia streptacantha TaxID=393608 RepID=A0A7C9EVL7_OPUST
MFLEIKHTKAANVTNSFNIDCKFSNELQNVIHPLGDNKDKQVWCKENRSHFFQPHHCSILKQSFKLNPDPLSVFFATPSFWHVVSMLDHHGHCTFRVQDKELICHSSTADGCYSSKNSCIPEQVTSKYMALQQRFVQKGNDD